MSSQESEHSPAADLGLPDLAENGAETAAALREDHIQNAVAFLSHPKVLSEKVDLVRVAVKVSDENKVRGSAVSAKRSFLEKKGLTAAEIDEAFKRVPEAPAAAPTAAPAAAPATFSSTPSYAANNLVTYTQPGHVAQPAVAHPPGSGMVASPSALVPMAPGHLQQLQPSQQQPLKWTHVVLGLGVAAASLYGLHQLLAPRLTAWSHQLFTARREAQEAEAARTAALTAALEKLAAGQERLQEAVDSMAAAVQQQSQQAASRYAASAQPDYMRCQSPSFALGSQQQYANSGYGSSMYGGDAASSRAAAVRGWDAAESGSYYRAVGGGGGARGSSHRAAGAGATGASGSPPDGFEVVPRSPAAFAGDNFSSITGPGSVRGYSGPTDARGGGSGALGPAATSRPGTGGQQQQQQQHVLATGRPDDAPHSTAFHEVMEMVRAGITPPNVRTDINDNPPDPTRPLTAPQLQPVGKPWERGSVTSNDIRTDSPRFEPPMAGSYAYHGQQLQQQAAVAASGGSAAGDAANGQYDNWSVASSDGRSYNTSSSIQQQQQQQQQSLGGLGVMAAMESSAAASKEVVRKAVGYDLTALLGQDAGRNSAPWRPPPPPAATVPRPSSSGSSSGKPAVAVSAAGTLQEAAVVQTSLSSTAADVLLAAAPQADDIVAGLAAQMVRNVVASAAAAAAEEVATA